MPSQRAGGFVRVTGLRDLQKALREIDKTLPRELGTANQKVAQHIINKATTAASRVGPMQARAARSLKAARQQRVAAIKFGGARYPFALGAEFGAGRNTPRTVTRGSTTYQMRGWNQFRQWRGSGSGAGYFLYPTIRREGDRIGELYLQVIDDLIDQHL